MILLQIYFIFIKSIFLLIGKLLFLSFYIYGIISINTLRRQRNARIERRFLAAGGVTAHRRTIRRPPFCLLAVRKIQHLKAQGVLRLRFTGLKGTGTRYKAYLERRQHSRIVALWRETVGPFNHGGFLFHKAALFHGFIRDF